MLCPGVLPESQCDVEGTGGAERRSETARRTEVAPGGDQREKGQLLRTEETDWARQSFFFSKNKIEV